MFALVITGAAEPTVTVRAAVLVPAAFVALMVTAIVAAAEGVPEMKPVAVLIDNPVGRLVAPKLVGEFVAVI